VKRSLIFAVLATALPGSVMAATAPSYDYVEITYAEIEPGEAYGVGLSKTLGKNFFLDAGATQMRSSYRSSFYGGNDRYSYRHKYLEETTSHIGAGYIQKASRHTDVVVTAGVARVESTVDYTNIRPGGTMAWGQRDYYRNDKYATAEIRAMASSEIELIAEAKRVWGDVIQTQYKATGRLYLNKQFSVQLSYLHLDDETTAYQFGLGYHF
jgi:hypothetical protein